MDFLPPQDLEEFIITEVLRAEVEQMFEDGQRFDVTTAFVAHNQRRGSHSLGTTRRASPATMTVRCRKSYIAGGSDLICDFAAETTSSGTGRFWRLTASIRKDEKGYYLTRRQFTSFHEASGSDTRTKLATPAWDRRHQKK